MKAFLKTTEKGWRLEEDQEVVLNSNVECIFAEDINEAIDYINRELNPHAPDFVVARKGYYHDDKDKNIIMIDPVLRDGMSFDRAVELIQEHGKIQVDRWSEASRLSFDGNLHEYGIIQNNLVFEYNPEKAKKENKPIPYGQSGRKNFICMWEISSLFYGLIHDFNSQFNRSYFIKDPHANVNTRQVFYHRRYKTRYCDEVLQLVKSYNNFFGKFSYRRITEFQSFKKSWKETKPKSPKQTGVTEHFFDFMQEEIKRRKPRVSTFTPRKITLDLLQKEQL